MRSLTTFGLFLLIGIACLAAPLPVQAQDIPPVHPAQVQVPGLPLTDTRAEILPSAMEDTQSLELVVQEYGQVTLSLDAVGTLDSSAKIQVQKPTNATVRKAYLLSATIWQGGQIAAGDVTLQGSPVSWEREIPNSLASYNYWADVTAVIKPVVDAAAPGIVDLAVGESSAKTEDIDGEILAVIFDDPNQAADNTILLYFGAQNVTGDTFNIEFGSPLSTDDPNFALNLSLGISYGYQSTDQYSQIDVNEQRLTTSAGGQDDGTDANGALITVGGIGDDPANPADPNATPSGARSDDELYDLRPFVKSGDTAIKIDTLNPSNDDNILFAAVELGGTRTTNTIDLTITLDNNPTTAEARAPYESIIRFLADGIYEESNGAHKLGRVTFYTNGNNSQNASIIWTTQKAGRPSANATGYQKPGRHIIMFNRMDKRLWFDYDFLENEEHQRMGGYVLAHEVGHYVYGLYDEYREDNPKNESFINAPHAKDKPVEYSIMNSPWDADKDLKWLNFSTAKNDTKETAQYRMYQASGWETLARPAENDPLNDELEAIWRRKYYPELAEVAPKSDELPRIDLPSDTRSALRIRWDLSSPPAVAHAADVNTQTIPLSAHVLSINGQNLAYPEPLTLVAFVTADLYVTDLNIQATVLTPLGETRTVTFTDDGVAPDRTAQDGLYSTLVPYTENGVHTISVNFDNAAGKAMFVDAAFMPVRPPDGVPFVPVETESVGENFVFTQNLQVVVSNLVADDHGNTVTAATILANNNVALPSRIDYAGDQDVFQLTALDAGATYVRITNRGLDMQPYMRILAPDGVTQLFAGTVENSGGPYLYQRVEGVPAGAQFYVIIADVNAAAVAGLYSISAGSPIAGDPQATTLAAAATPNEIVADGASTSRLQVMVQDANGLPMPHHSVTMSTNHGTLSQSSATDGLGVADAVLTAGTTAVTATVVVTAGNISTTVQVSFVAGPPAAIQLSATAAELPADGESTTTVTARVADANGNVIKGRDVAFTATLGTIASPVTTSADGVAVAALRAGKVAGTATVSATVGEATANVVIMLKQVIFNLYLPVVNKQ